MAKSAVVQTMARLPEPLRNALEKRAELDGDSINNVIIKAIEAYLKTTRAV